MSQNRELEFVEVEAGKWFYVLEDYSAPKNSWDWHEYAAAYGPFTSYEKACEHQYDFSRISTPGATITSLEHLRTTPALKALIDAASIERAF